MMIFYQKYFTCIYSSFYLLQYPFFPKDQMRIPSCQTNITSCVVKFIIIFSFTFMIIACSSLPPFSLFFRILEHIPTRSSFFILIINKLAIGNQEEQLILLSQHARSQHSFTSLLMMLCCASINVMIRWPMAGGRWRLASVLDCDRLRSIVDWLPLTSGSSFISCLWTLFPEDSQSPPSVLPLLSFFSLIVVDDEGLY